MTVGIAAYLVYVARMSGYILMHIETKGRYVPSIFVWIGMSFYLAMNLIRFFGLNYICEKISAKVNIHIRMVVHTYMCIRYNIFKIFQYIMFISINYIIILIKFHNIYYIIKSIINFRLIKWKKLFTNWQILFNIQIFILK